MASKKIKVDDFETKFSQMRIKRRTSTYYRELIKKYFFNENELCDWIINLWKYAKDMEHDETIMKKYHGKDHEKYISCEFLIDHLLRNDPSFFNFEVFIQAKDLSINKAKIYDIITKSCTGKQTQPVLTTLK